jgi:hypothetical protein
MFLYLDSQAQSQDFIFVELNYRVPLSDTNFVSEITIKHKAFKSFKFEEIRMAAQKDAIIKGANACKITNENYSDRQGKNMKNNYVGYKFNCRAYFLNHDEFQTLKDTIAKLSQIIKDVNHKKSWFNKLFSNDEVHDFQIYKSDSLSRFFKPLNRKFVQRRTFEIGGGMGIDFILNANLYFTNQINIYKGSNINFSIGHKSGAYAGFFFGVYTYPNFSLQYRIKNMWISAAYGNEFGLWRVDRNSEARNFKNRVDLGINIYKSKNSYISLWLPLRFDKEYSIVYGGMSFGNNLHF